MVSKKPAVLDGEKFEEVEYEYYGLGGRDVPGLQTRAKTEELELNDIADDLERRERIVAQSIGR